MAPQLPVASRSRARTKKEYPLARRFSKAEPGRRTGGSGAGIGGSRARQRASSVSGGPGAGDDCHEVIVITDDEDGSDEAISVSGSDEEEEEPCDYRLQKVRRSEPNQISPKDKDIAVVDDVGGDSDKEESIDFQSDDDLICCGEVRSFGKQGEGNGGSFGSEDGHYAQNPSGKNTPSVTEVPEADLSSGYLTSSTERSSTGADDSSDEDYVAYVSETLSTDTETFLSSGEYGEREENMKRRKKRAREDKGESSRLYSARRNNKKLAIDCVDDPMIDDVGRKENAERRVSWVNEWLLDDVEEKREEETISVDSLNAEIECPSNDDDGYSGQMEEGGSFSVPEGRGSRGTEETGRRGEDRDERLRREGKAAIEFDGVNSATDVSLGKKGKKGEMEERGNFRGPEEERPKQSREKSTSRSKVSGVDRRMEEKRYGKHVRSSSDPVIRDATSSKVESRKEKDLVISCGSRRQRKKRKKHEDCSGKKASADGVDENNSRADWKSRTRKERAREPWLNQFFELANGVWGKDELLQDDIDKENAEKRKQCAGDSNLKEERKESTECGIPTKPSEEDIGAHQAGARKDSSSTRDYGIRRERSGKSKESKYFKGLAEKFRSN